MIGAVAVFMTTLANIPLQVAGDRVPPDYYDHFSSGVTTVAITLSNSVMILLHQVNGRCSSTACTMQESAIADNTGRMIFVHLESPNISQQREYRDFLLATFEWHLFLVEIGGQPSLL
jgi:hypothetical protein